MSVKESHAGYGVYWKIWTLLLVLTVVMIFVDQVSMPRALLITLLVAAMMAKASLIAAYFMHLRLEAVSLALIVAVGLLATALALFVLIVPDAVRILELSAG